MAEFDYKQRPFNKKLTDEEYNRAVGRTPERIRITNEAGVEFVEAPCGCVPPCQYRHWKPVRE